jgi:hypothetical protein
MSATKEPKTDRERQVISEQPQSSHLRGQEGLDQEQALVGLDQSIADRDQALMNLSQDALDTSQRDLDGLARTESAEDFFLDIVNLEHRQGELDRHQERNAARQGQLDRSQDGGDLRQGLIDSQQETMESEDADLPPAGQSAASRKARAQAALDRAESAGRRAADAVRRAETAQRRAEAAEQRADPLAVYEATP